MVSGQTVRVTDREFVRHRTDYRLPILLAPLTPGAYLFRLEATAGAATVVKSVRFVVVP